MTDKPNIHRYLDYVTLLNDWYTYKKTGNNSFSYRSFALRAHFKSKSYLSDILNGKRALSRKSIFNIANALQFTDSETEYFSYLVHFKHCKTATEKNIYWAHIKDCQTPNLGQRKSFREFELLEHWYNVVIREIICLVDYQDDYKYLGRLVIPTVTAKQAKESVALLLEMGLVKREGNIFEQTSFELLVDPELKRLATHNFQRDVIGQGIASLDQLKDEDRNTQVISFGSNAIVNKKVDALISKFVKDVYQLVQENPEVDEVKQLNLQFFSLSKKNLSNKQKGLS